MALISTGGLGKEVHSLLRAATLPGSEWVLPLLAREWSAATEPTASPGCAGDPDRLGADRGARCPRI